MKNFKFVIVALTGIVLLGAGCTNTALISTNKNESASPATTSVFSDKTKLDLSGKNLERVSLDVFNQKGLEELNVSNNNLTGALPSQIGQLTNLRILNASGNNMTGVPAEIGKLTKLQELNLSNNQLTGLPMELGNLTALRKLDLRGNTISKQDLDGIRAKISQAVILE